MELRHRKSSSALGIHQSLAFRFILGLLVVVIALAPPGRGLEKPGAVAAQRIPPKQEVRSLIAKAFQGTVTIMEGRDAVAIQGDFNGDGSADLAVAVKPISHELARLNSQYANWLLEDPTTVPTLNMDQLVAGANPARQQIVAKADDVFLAIVHGHGREGWRSPLVTQFFLLRNSLGEAIFVEHKSRLNHEGVGRQHPPHLRGDVLRLEIRRQAGILYFNGAAYAWYAAGEAKHSASK